MKEYLIQGFLEQLEEKQDSGETSDQKVVTDLAQSSVGSPQNIESPLPKQLIDVSIEAGLRIEVWDKDNRYDDRLGVGRTIQGQITQENQGYFEIRFREEVLRQEPRERETGSEAEIFFKVFRGSHFLFDTESDYFNLRSGEIKFLPQNAPFETDPPAYSADDGYYYRFANLNVSVSKIPEVEPRDPLPSPIPQIPQDTIVDVLPTSDQIFGLGHRPTASSTTTSSGGSLQQSIDNAFNQVLGHSFQGNGNFQDSLTQAFTLEEKDGERTFTWNPRSYSTTQTDLGGQITGAQASLYHRAKAALKEILPLLDGLYDLDPASDKQNRHAVRSIVRTEIVELVNEMGVHQGPRVQRVNSLFELLLGNQEIYRLPEQLGGQLKDLADAFGLHRSRINTVDEERNYGNFLIIRDYILSLRGSWQDYLSIQQSGGGAFVGTQLVLLSQALAVMAESVRETYRIMDLVFLGPEERQSVWIDFTKAQSNMPSPGIAFPLPDGTGYPVAAVKQLQPAMDLERLLSWAMRFATDEGPTLARSGGKLGIANAIASTAEHLMILLQAASYVPVGNLAFRRAGSLRALRDLAFQTYQVKHLAQELIPPNLSDQPDDAGDSDQPFSQIFQRISDLENRFKG